MLLNNRIRKLDFQDLVIFQLIYQFQSITEVAEQLSVSQSTISYCLKRLRDSLNDDLFINTRLGMVPTQKAETLKPKIGFILRQMTECVQDDQTTAASVDKTTFTIYAPEYFEILVMPVLMKNIWDAGLSVSINITQPEKDIPYADIANGQIDLAIFFGPGFYRLPTGLHSQKLFTDKLVAVSEKHDDADTSAMSLEQFLSRKHIFPSPWVSNSNLVDSWLHAQGVQRNIAAKANSYYSALKLLAGNELLLMLPSRVYDRIRYQHPALKSRQAPVGLPEFSIDMIWGTTHDTMQANSWLRKQLLRACSGI